MMTNKIILEVYKNNKLVNTFNNEYDNIKSLIDCFYSVQFVSKNYKLKEKTNYTDKMDFTFICYNYNYDGTKDTYKYIYKNIPCQSNRLDTNKLLKVIEKSNDDE